MEQQQLQSAGPTMLDPELVVAARRGDSRWLEYLLRVLDEEGEEATAMPAEVVVAVDGPAAAAAAAVPPAPPASGGSSLLYGETITEGDSLLHVVAACGDSDNFVQCAKMICGKRGGRVLLLVSNKNGDTPLHCAAGAGNPKMISCLLDLAARGRGGHTAVKELLRKRNNLAETALHQAVRAANNKLACIDKLMSVDAELGCIPWAGEGGASTLYLAISLGELEVARHLLDTSGGRVSYCGPHGDNVFHAAVVRGTGSGGGRNDADAAVGMLVEWFKHRLPLLSQLTNQREGYFGCTPLATAAMLSATTATTMRLLLEVNVSAAYLPTYDGWYPIHVAGSGDRPDHVEILLEKCPDCATLRDARGRTFLHAAVAGNWRRVVNKYACTQENRLSSVLNAQDKEGNTALHLAVDVGDLDIFNCLIRNPQVRLDVPNGFELTPVRLARRQVPTIFYDTLHSRSLIQDSLELMVGAPRGVLADTIDDDEKSKNLRDATQVMGVVSVLVATVTFASAFTLPGGYRSADDANSTHGGGPAAAGTPLLAGRRSYGFDAFVLADTLAFVCSSMATFSLVFAGMPFMDLSIRYRCFLTSFGLMRGAVRSLLAAFALGLYVVLAPVDLIIAIVVCVIILASLLCGHLETWRAISTANAAFARFGGLQKPAAMLYARSLRRYVLGNFWTFIIIFGLPAAIRIKAQFALGR